MEEKMGCSSGHSRALVFLACLIAPFGEGCSGDSGGGAGAGERCESFEDCRSSICGNLPGDDGRRKYCTEDCSGGGACPEGMVCATFHGGSTLCTKPCTNLADYSEHNDPNYACIDGVPTPCSSLPYGSQCVQCGCAEGEYCDAAGHACSALIEEGQPCLRHDQCITGNCDSVDGGEKICLAAIGESCTTENCQMCQAHGTFCSRYCEDDMECPEGWICAGKGGTYWCLIRCSSEECCTYYPDCGYCSPMESRCPEYQSCDPIVYEYITIDYGCFDDD
jgi:hypothetical protein